MDDGELADRLKTAGEAIKRELRKIIVGQDVVVEQALIALFAGGNCLLVGVPGLAKTLLISTMSRALDLKFSRIQFTPDLMPSDVTGTDVIQDDPDTGQRRLTFMPGPVFTNVLLADEINRTPPKTQSALLEAMQERRVTVQGRTYELDPPFFVFATQNPIELEGTYPLPEAQLDRFMLKIVADYPAVEEEANILRMHSKQIDLDKRLQTEVETVTGPAEIMEITALCAEVLVDDRLLNYINSLVRKTREWPQFYMGASPRAGLALVQGARTLAAFRGRDYTVPDDVVEIALPALRHRVMLTAEAEVEGHNVDQLLKDLVRSVEVPRM